jgi:hypothetical protein
MKAEGETPESVKTVVALICVGVPALLLMAMFMWVGREKPAPDVSDSMKWVVSQRALSDGVCFTFSGDILPPGRWKETAQASDINPILEFVGLSPVKGMAVDEESKTKHRWDRNTFHWPYEDGKQIEVHRTRHTVRGHRFSYDAIHEIRVVSSK